MAVSRRPGTVKSRSGEGTASSAGRSRGKSTPQPARASETPPAEDLPSTDEPEAHDSERPFHLRQRFRQTSALTVSAIIHLVAIVTLGLLVIEPQAVATVQEVIAQVMDEPDPRDELKVELENQLSDVQDT